MASVSALKRYIKERIKVTSSGCWEWQRSKVSGGYGHCKQGEKAVTTHRLAYQLWRGPIPRGLFIRHKCHNPPCCNPRHLQPGTHEDNTLDIVKRGKKRRRLTDAELTLVLSMRKSGETVNAIATALKSNFYLIQEAVRGVAGRLPGRPKGTKNMHVRITDAMKNKMRERYATGKVTQQKLADRFGCSQDYVSIIVRQPER